MSNGYDYFGGSGAGASGNQAPRAEGAMPPPGTDRFGMPTASYAPPVTAQAPPFAGATYPTPTWQQPVPPSPSKTNRLWFAIASCTVVAAVAAVAFAFFHSSGSVPLPSTVAGFPKVHNLPTSVETEIQQMRHQLAKNHLKDATAGVYGDLDGRDGMLVVAARVDGRTLDMAQISAAFDSGAGQLGGNTVSGKVTSGSTQFECIWQRPGGAQVTMCIWVSGHSYLFGNGFGMDVQSTADALAGVKDYASLN